MNKILIFLISCCIVLNTSFLSAQQTKPSKEETLKELTEELNSDRDIIAKIPGLKVQKDDKGKEYYSYAMDNKEKRLEDLDEDTLEDLLNKAYDEGQTIKDKEIIQQTETLRQNRQAMQESANVREFQGRAKNQPESAPKK